MIRRTLRWMWDRPVRTAVAVGLAGALAANLWAWMHARAMTHFTATGERTAGIEELSLTDKLRAVFLGVNVPKPANARSPSDLGLSFTTHRLVAPDGTGLEAWHVPAEKPKVVVVAAHGYAIAKSQLLPATRVLHRLGCDVVLVDLRAAGGSDGHVCTLGYEEARDVAAAAAFATRTRPDLPLVLYGYSMGAAAVTRAIAKEGVRPAAVMIESAFARLLDTVTCRFRMMGLPDFPAAHLLVFWGGVQLGFDGFSHNPIDYAKKIACPVLVLAGENDRRSPPDRARAIWSAANGSGMLKIFPGCGHDSAVVAREDEWQDVVARFLEEYAFEPPPEEKPAR